MNKNSLRSSIKPLIAGIASLCLLCGFGNATHDKNYECAGKNDNGMVIFREFPTLNFSGHRVMIAGSDIFSKYSYEVCDERDSRVSFATRPEVCRAVSAGLSTLDASSGSFNIVTGRLELYGAQGISGEYQCKESRKKY